MIAVHPDGQGPDAAVAAIDVIADNVGEVRWLDVRLLMSDRDAILERLERALWAAYEVDPQRDENVEVPSPLKDLEEMMERRSKALGARAKVSQNLGRTDGYQQIAEALRDLAEPDMVMVEVLEDWLGSVNLMDAAEVVGRARGAQPVAVRQLMSELWDSIIGRVPVEEVEGTPGRLRVNDAAIFGSQGSEFVLQRVVDGERASLRRVRVTKKEAQGDDAHIIDDATERLTPGAELHERTEILTEFSMEDAAEFIGSLYSRIGKFHDELVRAPRTLQDVRTLLYWTAVMLDAPLCQGQVKARATAAFEQAKGLYDLARRHLAEGRSVDAVRRMHAALQRISAAAAEIARSCGEGQIDIAVTPPHLPVSAADRAAIEARSHAVTTPTQAASARPTRCGDSQDPVSHAREALTRAGIDVDPVGLRVVGRLGECRAPNATARDLARKALRDAGIHASIVRDRLLFPLRQP